MVPRSGASINNGTMRGKREKRLISFKPLCMLKNHKITLLIINLSNFFQPVVETFPLTIQTLDTLFKMFVKGKHALLGLMCPDAKVN